MAASTPLTSPALNGAAAPVCVADAAADEAAREREAAIELAACKADAAVEACDEL